MNIKSVIITICFAVQSFTGVFAAEFIVHVSGQDTNEVTEHLTIAQDADGLADFSGGDLLSQSGEPQIPWKVMTLLLPPNADMETVACRMVSSEYKTLEGAWDIAPAPPMVTANPAQTEIWPSNKTIVEGRDTAIYSRDALWPTEKVHLEATGRLRSWRLAEISLPMVRFNPVSGELQELVRAEVSVDFNKKGKSSKAKSSQSKSSKAKKPSRNPKTGKRRGYDRVNRLTENFDTTVMLYAATEDGTKSITPDTATDEDEMVSLSSTGTNGYVIITTQAIRDTSTKLADFVTHKENMGFTVTVVDEDDLWGTETPVEGDPSATKLREWLQANYEVLDLKYALIIGDPRPDQGYVPMKIYPDEGKDIPTDYFYAELTCDWDKDGDGIIGEWREENATNGEEIERYFEVYVGRIPYYGVIADTDGILQKTIDYETSTDRAWRRKFLISAKPLDTRTSGHEWGEQIKADHLEPKGISSDRVYKDGSDFVAADAGIIPPPEFPATTEIAEEVWSTGQYGLHVWSTHGYATGAAGIISSGEAVEYLTDNYPSTVFQASCQNAWPENTNNLSYTLLKKGGILTIGATRNSYYAVGENDASNTGSGSGMSYRYVQGISEGKSCGEALWGLKEEITSWWRGNWTDFNPYGDPSVVILSSTPDFTITPTDAFFTTKELGDVSSASRSYTLINNSGSALNWIASKSEVWLDLSATNGTISAGGSVVVNMTLNEKVAPLMIDTHEAFVTFTDTSNNLIEERSVLLDVVVPEGPKIVWDFNGLSVGNATTVISVPPTTNTFDSGVSVSDLLLTPGGTDRIVRVNNDRAELGLYSGGNTPHPTVSFTVTIDAETTISLEHLAVDLGFNETSATGNDITPFSDLIISTGSASPSHVGFEEVSPGLILTNVVSTLSGLSDLTDTSVTFTWTFDALENRGNNLRVHVIDTIVLSGPLENQVPIAHDAERYVFNNESIAITLMASDFDNDPLTYTLLDFPSHGVLSGTAPNLTYTPDSDYSGLDEFTFKANDGEADSSVATVSIKVLDPDYFGVFLWDFNTVEDLTSEEVITVPVDSNTFGSGVMVSDLTVSPGALGFSSYVREVKLINDRLELVVNPEVADPPPQVSFTVTIDANTTVSLRSFAADLGFLDLADGSPFSPYIDLVVSQGAISPNHVAFGIVPIGETTTNIVSTLSELEALTDTSITFTLLFHTDRSIVSEDQMHLIDNIELLVERVIVDSDGDNLPDVWETRMGLDPLSGEGDDGADADPDGDGFSNLEEYATDTHPLDDSSVLQMIGMESTPSGIEIRWQGGELAQQELAYAQSLMDPDWTVYTNLVPPTMITNTVVVPASTNRATFFRIRASRP